MTLFAAERGRVHDQVSRSAVLVQHHIGELLEDA